MNLSAARTTRRPPPLAKQLDLVFHRFSVDDYHRMIDARILTTDHKVELLDGWIINKMPQNPPPSTCIARLTNRVPKLLPKGWHLRVQLPISLSASEPEPDVAIVRGSPDDFEVRHPGPDDIGLLIEVAQDSLLTDRVEKTAIYAQAKIAEYWIVNLVDSVVEVHARPRNERQPAFQQQKVYHKGESIPIVLGGKKIGEIAVRDILR